MNIGDRVRLLHGTEEGVIVKIINDKLIEIEIEEGFTIPAVKNEVVVIAAEEKKQFRREENISERSENTDTSQVIKEQLERGIFLAFEDLKNTKFKAYLINQTKSTALFSVRILEKKQWKGVESGSCASYTYTNLGEIPLSWFADNRKLLIQVIYHEEINPEPPLPLSLEIILDNNLLKQTDNNPVVKKEVRMIKIERQKLPPVNPATLRESLMEGGNKSSSSFIKSEEKPVKEEIIDLHIEHIAKNYATINTNDYLNIQMKTFEKELDNAILKGVPSLKIIHGVGNGILRDNIHKKLSQMTEVKYFEDVDKEKFGFGATRVHF